jgi:hypothetical protein
MSSSQESRTALATKHNLSVLEEGQIATQNKRGMQMATISPLFETWVNAYGINSVNAIKRGAEIIGVDMGREHFAYVEDLYQLALQENPASPKLTLMTGSLPNHLPLAPQSVSAILLGEVLSLYSWRRCFAPL